MSNKKKTEEMKKQEPVQAETEMKAATEVKEDPAPIDIKAIEEAAMARVLKAVGLKKEDLESIEKQNIAKAKNVVVNIGHFELYVNGQLKTGRIECTQEEADQLLSMAANMKNRRMQEMIGKSGMATLVDNQIRAEIKVTKAEDAAGNEVSL